MKKQWISVKCGLSRDPKHRQAMGESVWLFLHILDRADWESGKVLEWKDEAEADEMGMPVRTLREHRRKLEELEYILCTQRQYGQEITIHNWTNPREYSGTVTNKKQGGNETSPSLDGQGDTHGYIQGSRKDVTPTFNSKNQNSGKKGDLVDGLLHFGKIAKEQGADKAEEIIQTLERGLRVNIDRSLKNQQVAKRILKDGRPLDTWLSWAKAEEWRAAHLYLYADLEKVWRDFPQAFDNTDGYNPQQLQVGL